MAAMFTKIYPQLRFVAKLIVHKNEATPSLLPPGAVATLPLRCFTTRTTTTGIQTNISSLQLKKRPPRKKRIADMLQDKPGVFSVVAYATAEEYDLERLVDGLKRQELYETRPDVDAATDVVHAVAKYRVEQEPREIFFFREGSVVMWNVSDLESGNVLAFLRHYEQDGYAERMVHGESEIMTYGYNASSSSGCSLLQTNGEFVLTAEQTNTLAKYTFSNAMALSVKLGLWEASLDKYIDSIEFVTEDLKRGVKIKMTQDEVLRKHGELFALRHLINLSSDLLDTPDFYWDREDLETLYNQTCNYFSISKRTRVMNEKINHCVELVELLTTHLSDRHHVRLEWMIIILIMVEVGFEIIHYMDRFFA